MSDYFVGIYEVNPMGFGEKLVHILYRNVSEEFCDRKVAMLNLNMGFHISNCGIITEPGNIYAAYDHMGDLEYILNEKCDCGSEYIYLQGQCHDCSQGKSAVA